ncbi:uncharacterized protein KGF55_000604 [Candida pseudojiufengensis]|uniref:uncharacterized protein n=1 Tax=Candida pseudojiufengensis TaxID=497109 RepID=UPI00222427E9|nr:uncharacterized protein KGF55_000604 [Candida pseudojiufengensis]KAI5966295.1 hypothetical protein KGF55_000604 [Candida pseudojiufengensis]
MDLAINQIKNLIKNQDLNSISSQSSYSSQQRIIQKVPSKVFIPESLIKFWCNKSSKQKSCLLLQIVLVSVAFYICLPSIPLFQSNQRKMFSKRPDKHTTGLINLRNDCFANSSLQAYSSLPSLTDYLNKFIVSYRQLSEFINTHKLDVDALTKLRMEHNKSLQNSKFKSSNAKFTIPLHIALAQMVKKLQETQMTTKTISVWTFLHELENIFQAKISRSQHDAHELTQLINETLENENLKLKSFHKFITLNLHHIMPKGNQPNPQDYTQLERISIPEFPFDGLILGQMTCLKCHGVSKPTFTPFVMLTLPAPMKPQANLESLLEDNESETIEGYQCLKCRIDKIVANELLIQPTRKFHSLEEEQFIHQIFDLHNNPHLCINEDIPEPLENYIKNYNVNGIDISKVTSTVSKKSHILKPPKIFGIHLSRSAFDGQTVSRNSCRVTFKDNMSLSIGKEYHDRLKNFQTIVQDDEEKLIKQLSSKVLTTDENDMEDEDVQRGDYLEKGEPDEDLDEDNDEATDDNETIHNGTTEEEDEDDDDDDEVDDDLSSRTSIESTPQTITTSTTIRPPNSASSEVENPTINKAPINDQQTENLREHFKKFKFNENDIYKYRLKAIIRHMGSHTQGHYECYKHKPLYVKNKDGNIFKLSPEIMDLSGEVHYDVSPVDEDTSEKKNSRFSIRSGSNASASDDDGIRHRFSSMIGRRPSVIQANPRNVEEIIQSGLQTPAEILVDDPMKNNFDNAFAKANFKSSFQDHPQESSIENGISTNGSQASTKQPEKKVKMKKIQSLISNPYWRISDGNINEVSRNAVLAEETTVYMLYYERVDRKQIKRSHRN